MTQVEDANPVSAEQEADVFLECLRLSGNQLQVLAEPFSQKTRSYWLTLIHLSAIARRRIQFRWPQKAWLGSACLAASETWLEQGALNVSEDLGDEGPEDQGQNMFPV